MSAITPPGAAGLRPPAPGAAHSPDGAAHRAEQLTPISAGPHPRMRDVTFIVHEEPVAAERPRTVTLPNGDRRTYTPKKTLDAEQRIGWEFKARAGNWRPDKDLRYGVEAVFYLHKGGRRDVDNLLKTVLDGLNKVAWPDDSQVVEVVARVHRGRPHAHSRITVRVVQAFEEA